MPSTRILLPDPWPSAEGPGLCLALGGGGARALAHLGVLQVLEREGIRVAAIAGTSMGGLLGALVAAGIPLSQIEELLAQTTGPRELLGLIDLGVSKTGISVRGGKLYRVLVEALGGEIRFESLRFPFAAVAADLVSGRDVALKDGLVADAVRATISIPGVFEPVERGPLRLIDGAVLHNLPVSVARSLAPRPVVAVDVLPHFRENRAGEAPTVTPLDDAAVPNVLEWGIHVVIMAIAEMTALRLAAEPADLVLRPAIAPSVTLLTGFDAAEEVVAAGRHAAEQALPHLRELAGRPGRAP